MSERWGDSRQDREALDRWLEREPPEDDGVARAQRMGRFTLPPGSTTVDRIPLRGFFHSWPAGLDWYGNVIPALRRAGAIK